METKLFELRDSATFVPVIAIKLNPECEEERYLLGRAGYGTDPEQQAEYVLLAGLQERDSITCDIYGHGMNRTRQYAHDHIIKNWDNLKSGAVIDVEFILGESDKPKESERIS